MTARHPPTRRQDLTETQVREFKDAFKVFDADNSGTITPEELGDVMRTLGQNPTDQELKHMLEGIDMDGNGAIDFDEFISFMLERMAECPDPDEDLMEAFKVFDRDNNGYITAEELQEVLTKVGEPLTIEQANNMIKEFDLNKDGKLNYKEFAKMMNDTK